MNEDDSARDDLLASVSKIIEEFFRNMPGERGPVAGFMVVPRGPARPASSRVNPNDDRRRLPYETIESPNFIYITIGLPPEGKQLPWVDIAANSLRIFIDDRVATIVLKQSIDVLHSYYRVHRRVLDITLRKVRPVAQLT